MELLHRKKAQATGLEIALVVVAVIVFAVLLFIAVSYLDADKEPSARTDDSSDTNFIEEFTNLAFTDNVCPYPLGTDSDEDGVDDACDNCPAHYNPDQLDNDHDGEGNECDYRTSEKGDDDEEDDDNDAICSSNSDCPADQYTANFCSNGDSSKNHTTYSCRNPGRESSYCAPNTVTELVEACQYGCEYGQCKPQPNITCTSDAQCPADGDVGSPFCSGNDVYQKFRDYMCTMPGSLQSMCGFTEISNHVRTCPYACADSSGDCTRCDENLDCNDNNSSTNDVCILPDTPLSSCQNNPNGQCSPGQPRTCGQTNVGECTIGTETCNSNGQWGSCNAVMPRTEVCDGDDNDCDGKTDEGGVCGPSCNNECTAGTKQCYNGGVRMCGDYDSDSCTEWSGTSQCSTGDTCQSGNCVPQQPSCTNECTAGTKQCYNGGVRLCGYFDNDSCSEWSGTSQCSTGDTCQSGNCVPQQPSCTNECTPGLKVCSGNGVKLCGYFDNDSCSEWSSPSTCSTGQTCQSGVCN